MRKIRRKKVYGGRNSHLSVRIQCYFPLEWWSGITVGRQRSIRLVKKAQKGIKTNCGYVRRSMQIRYPGWEIFTKSGYHCQKSFKIDSFCLMEIQTIIIQGKGSDFQDQRKAGHRWPVFRLKWNIWRKNFPEEFKKDFKPWKKFTKRLCLPEFFPLESRDSREAQGSIR